MQNFCLGLNAEDGVMSRSDQSNFIPPQQTLPPLPKEWRAEPADSAKRDRWLLGSRHTSCGCACCRKDWAPIQAGSAGLILDDPKSRRRRSEKVLLPALRNPATYAVESNQREADAEWDDPHRRLRRRRRQVESLPPQLAYIYLPPVFPFVEHRYDETRRHSLWRNRATKTFRRQHLRRKYDTSSGDSGDDSSCSSSDEDDHIPMPQKKTTMRSQRMRSLADMAKLQNDAATTIQSEYRFYRRRLANRNRRKHRLAMQAQTFLDVFLLREMTSLVPVCLLEVLRETRAQEAVSVKLKKDFAASLADDMLVPLIDESIRNVFHDVLQATVESYLAEQLGHSTRRAATPMAVSIATDILDNWIKELVENLLPEVLVEMASEYTLRQRHEVVWEMLLEDELQSVALDAVEDFNWRKPVG